MWKTILRASRVMPVGTMPSAPRVPSCPAQPGIQIRRSEPARALFSAGDRSAVDFFVPPTHPTSLRIVLPHLGPSAHGGPPEPLRVVATCSVLRELYRCAHMRARRGYHSSDVSGFVATTSEFLTSYM